MNSSNNIVRVGIGVWIFNPRGQLLLGRRLSKHGNGTWAPPGGHLEFGETPIETAIREVREETDLIIPSNQVREISWTNDIFQDKHYITIHCRVDNFVGTPKIMESNKCAEWRWCDLNALPQPLFLSAVNLLRQKVL